MARYGTFLYGAELYGATPTENFNLWQFRVDWKGDLSYSPPSNTFNNEAVRMIGFSSQRGRDYLLRPDGRGFEHYGVGEAVGIFDNADGRYDPWNTSSPLYPYVKPGKFVQIKVKNGTSGSEYSVMRGTIQDIQPLSRGKNETVRIVVHDGLQWLRDRSIEKGLQSSQTIAQCIDHILAGADWPAEWGSSSVSSVDSLDYWWAWKQNALDAIHQLEDAELGVFIHDKDGQPNFRGRNYTYEQSSTVAQDTLLSDMVLPQPWEVVRNRIEIYSYPKILDPVNTTLWQLRDTPAIANGEVFNVDAIFSYSTWRPCGSSITFNHTVNTQADGLGTDMTASCPLTYNTDIGDGAEITITNNYGSAGYITLLRAVGNAIYPPNQTVRKNNNAASAAAYGPRTLIIDSRWQEDSVVAQDLADFLLANLKDPNATPIIRFEGRPTYQFYWDLYDRLVLTIAAKGITSVNYRVGKIEHEWLSQNGVSVRTTFKLEPYWVFV